MEDHASCQIALVATATGEITALSGVSPAALAAGMSRRDFVGYKLWDFSENGDAEMIRQRFADAAQRDVEQVFEVGSQTSRPERWRVRYIPAVREAKVLVLSDLIESTIRVTDKEIETLHLLAEDKNVHQIARSQGITERAVRARTDSLKLRFGAKTMHGLVAAAIRAGF